MIAKFPALASTTLAFLALGLMLGAMPTAALEPSDRGGSPDSIITLETVVDSAGVRATEPTTTLITSDWVDVRDILKMLADSKDLALQIAPDVEGRVNVHLEGVKFLQALEAVLAPNDMGYELIDGTLIVYKNGMISRWFNFDYLITTRSGRGTLRISGRSKGSGGIASGGSDGENESHVSSTLEMAIWPELIGALQTLVFDGQAAAAAEADATSAFSHADTEGRSLVISPMAGLVHVTAEWNRIQMIEEYLARMRESLHRQVAIEVKILEVTLDKGMRSGIDWSGIKVNDNLEANASFKGTEDLVKPFFQFVIKGKSATSLIKAVETQGNVKVISTPRITTLNNQKSVVRIVTEEVFYEAQVEPPVVTDGVITESIIAYSPSVIPVGIVLDVTPQIGGDGIITLNIHPTITDILRVVTSPNQDQAPVITVRELDTVGKVRTGETLVMAGLIQDSVHDTEHSVPFLGRIPFLSYFFKRTVQEESKTELVMLLTPVILNEQSSGLLVTEALESIDKMTPIDD